MDWFQYAAFVLASVAVVIVPGPTVTVIIANSLRDGSRSGLLNVAGTQAGLLVMLLIVAAGLEVIIENMAVVFDWVRLVGAAYLIWLGVKLIRSRGRTFTTQAPRSGSYFWQGFLVIWSNPKALLFLGAFIPQFVDPRFDPVLQTLILGGTFMAVATVLDSAYALVSGKAGEWLSQRNIRRLEAVSGGFLIGGGVWLALSRR